MRATRPKPCKHGKPRPARQTISTSANDWPAKHCLGLLSRSRSRGAIGPAQSTPCTRQRPTGHAKAGHFAVQDLAAHTRLAMAAHWLCAAATNQALRRAPNGRTTRANGTAPGDLAWLSTTTIATTLQERPKVAHPRAKSLRCKPLAVADGPNPKPKPVGRTPTTGRQGLGRRQSWQSRGSWVVVKP